MALTFCTTLECQHLEARATMMYKNVVHVDQTYLSYNRRNTCSHLLHLYHLPTGIDAYCNSFYPLSIRIWSNLPECVISSTTVDLFKYRLCELEAIWLVISITKICMWHSSGGLYIIYKLPNYKITKPILEYSIDRYKHHAP